MLYAKNTHTILTTWQSIFSNPIFGELSLSLVKNLYMEQIENGMKERKKMGNLRATLIERQISFVWKMFFLFRHQNMNIKIVEDKNAHEKQWMAFGAYDRATVAKELWLWCVLVSWD